MSNSQNIKPAKKYYEHLGGKLGELLLETFIEKKWIAKKDSSEKHLYITELGEKEFEKLGLDLSKIKSEVL